MNTRPVRLFLLPVLLTGFGLLVAGPAPAQTFTMLHAFPARPPSGTNSDGALPFAGLILSGNTLYGTAGEGGSSGYGYGTVFSLQTDTTNFTTVSSLPDNSPPGGFGVQPEAGLVLSGNTLYGTAAGGGDSQGNGTVFKVNTNGTGFTAVYIFTVTHTNSLRVQTNSDGAFPRAELILSGSTLYGTASNGGTNGNGTVFKVNTGGTGFTTLHNFTAETTNALGIDTNSDGVNPYAGLLLSSNTLYGTTYAGGSSGFGTVFAVNTDGSGFTTLHSFTLGSDGGTVNGGLILSGSTLYGTTYNGGKYGSGTVFGVNTNGSGFTNIYSFSSSGFSSGYYTNSDGGGPLAGLILSGNTLFGTTALDGAHGSGTVFAVNTDGSGFTTLHSFAPLVGSIGFSGTNSDGARSQAGLVLSGNTLYGTAFEGGSSGWGTVFSLSLGSVSPPQLTINSSGANAILTWSTNAASFSLQSTTNLSSGNWSNITSGITIVGTNYVFTNTMSGNASFFRLMQ